MRGPALLGALGMVALALCCAPVAAQEATVDGLLSLIHLPGGGLSSGWRFAGYGCVDCNFNDRLRRRNTSTSSIYSQLVPWGQWRVEADLPFTGNSVLDAWVKGSVLSSGGLFLENTVERRHSKWLTLDGADRGDAKVLAGPDADGWYHIQVNFLKLTDTSGTKLSGLPSMWNRICILDKSGTGFTLQLDTAFLYSSDAFFQTTSDGEADPSAPFPCVGKLCDERPSSNTVSAENLSPLVPLYDADEDFSVQGDADQQIDATAGFIMRLKPNVTVEELDRICAELATTEGPSRFNGTCITDEHTARAQVDADPQAHLEWSFQSFAVESEPTCWRCVAPWAALCSTLSAIAAPPSTSFPTPPSSSLKLLPPASMPWAAPRRRGAWTASTRRRSRSTASMPLATWTAKGRTFTCWIPGSATPTRSLWGAWASPCPSPPASPSKPSCPRPRRPLRSPRGGATPMTWTA